METVIASTCDPTDFKAMPRDAGDRTVFSPPEWAVRTNEAGGGTYSASTVGSHSLCTRRAHC